MVNLKFGILFIVFIFYITASSLTLHLEEESPTSLAEPLTTFCDEMFSFYHSNIASSRYSLNFVPLSLSGLNVRKCGHLEVYNSFP